MLIRLEESTSNRKITITFKNIGTTQCLNGTTVDDYRGTVLVGNNSIS